MFSMLCGVRRQPFRAGSLGGCGWLSPRERHSVGAGGESEQGQPKGFATGKCKSSAFLTRPVKPILRRGGGFWASCQGDDTSVQHWVEQEEGRAERCSSYTRSGRPRLREQVRAAGWQVRAGMAFKEEQRMPIAWISVHTCSLTLVPRLCSLIWLQGGGR